MKTPEAEADARPECDPAVNQFVRVQELQFLSPQGLELEEGHLLRHGGNSPYQGRPRAPITHQDRQGPLLFAGVPNEVDDRRLLAGVLLQDLPRGMRACLPPIQPDQVLGDCREWHMQRRTRVVPHFNGDAGDRQQQRELVGGGEAPLGQQALQIGQELDLCAIARCRHGVDV